MDCTAAVWAAASVAASPFTAAAAVSAAAVALVDDPVTGRSASVCSASTAVDRGGAVEAVDLAVVVAGGLQRGLERRRVVGRGL